MKKIRWWLLLLAIIMPFIAAAIGSYFTTPNIAGWYVNLNKPFFSPPNWLFAPVWTILYLMMGIAIYLIWSQQGIKFNKTQIPFYLQLILNAGWSIIFFGYHFLLGALLVIIILWLLIINCLVKFKKVSLTAMWLLIPYLLWVSFASLLNFSFWYLNQ